MYGPSHWVALAVFAAGAVAVVWLGRRQTERQARIFGRVVGAITAAIYAAAFVNALFPPDLRWSVPLHLTDLATMVTAYAMWSQRQWAYVLTYYWGLVLSVQALISPVLTGPDFPHYQFLGFWAIHLLVVWAAIYLTWGRGMRPGWRSYRFVVAVTLTWAAVTMTFNSIAGSELRLPQRKTRHSVIAGRDGAVAVVRAGRSRARGGSVGGHDLAVGTRARRSDSRVVGMLLGQLSHTHAVDQAVQRARHRGAFARGMLRRTVQGVREELLCPLGLPDHLVELIDLFADDFSPLGSGRIEDRGGRVERDAELMKDLDERQAAQVIGSIHSPAGPPLLRSHQPAFVVIAQRGRGQPQPGRGLADRNQVHCVSFDFKPT